MPTDCISIPKEFITLAIILWGILSFAYLGKKGIDDTKFNIVETILFWVSLAGIGITFATLAMYIMVIIIDLLSLLPCIRIV